MTKAFGVDSGSKTSLYMAAILLEISYPDVQHIDSKLSRFCIFLSSLTMVMSKMEKIKKVAPQLRELVLAHEEGTYAGGTQAWNSLVMKTIQEAGLLSKEIRHPSVVGVHPDNKEKNMLVPMDVHDLLLCFQEDGYNPCLWYAMAMTIPTGTHGQLWRDANAKLVEDSEGLLAECDASALDILTGRGSHSSAALRCAHFGANSPHPSLCDAHGRVSKSVLLQHQPSWQQPLEQGLMYTIFPGELEVEVPGLLAALSRVGNAHHDVFRQKTALQMCNRIHALLKAKKNEGKSVDAIAKIAVQGNGGSQYLPQCKQLITFVQAWSGGVDGKILQDLEHFERSCNMKRKLAPADLETLGKVDMMHASIYIKASCFNLAVNMF